MTVRNGSSRRLSLMVLPRVGMASFQPRTTPSVVGGSQPAACTSRAISG